MRVIVAEKSSAAEAIADSYNVGNQKKSYKGRIHYWEFEKNGEKTVITHFFGHIATLYNAKDYDDVYKKWDLDVYPCLPEKPQVKILDNAAPFVPFYKKLFNMADTIICATDSDREGEVIFSYAMRALKIPTKSKEMLRCWIPNDLTPQKIKSSMNNLKPLSFYKNFLCSGVARSVTDMLIGYNLTVAATVKYRLNDWCLHIGRVQTAVLSMAVKREEEVVNHTPTYFWTIDANIKKGNKAFTAHHDIGKFKNESEANRCLAKLNNCKKIVVNDIKTHIENKNPPQLFSTTDFLSECAEKLGWNPDKASKIYQELYDKKYLSYPRTSSVHISAALLPELKATIAKLMVLFPEIQVVQNEWCEIGKRYVDDKKIDNSGHVALYPTTNIPKLSSLSADQKAIYKMIALSAVRMVYKPLELKVTDVTLTANGEIFKSTGKEISNKGWFSTVNSNRKPMALPKLSVGEELDCEIAINKHETSPPKRYTVSSMLNAMKKAGKDVVDEEAQEIMRKEGMGLGTDATRSNIITTLFARDYIAKKGNSIVPTEKAKYLISVLPIESLTSVELTAEYEKKLKMITDGKLSYRDYINDIYTEVNDWYNKIKNDNVNISNNAIAQNLIKDEKLICPVCGNVLRIKQWGIGCSNYKGDNGCKFSISNTIAGKKITDNQLERLVTKGSTGVIKGFTAKSGKKFDCKLVLNPNTNKIEFDFSQTTKRRKGA